MTISVVMIVKLHSEAGEFQYFLHPNEPPQRIPSYLTRQLEADLSKNLTYLVFKVNFLVVKSL